jgi:hypothetical protein
MTTLALMWDCNGLEACEIVEDIDQKRVWAVLRGQDPNQIRTVNFLHWQLRARFNSQRHYEIYLISVDKGITPEDIRTAFEADPQSMADTVRRIGHCLHSDRADHDVRIR